MRYILAGAKDDVMWLYKKYWFNHFLLTQLDKHWLNKLLPILWEWNSLIIDSWAFSVWTKGKNLDIDEYWRFCVELNKKYWHKLELYYINLDVIPWSPWRKPTKEQIEDSARISYERMQYLSKKYPVKWMPVFHQHEDFEWLQKYIDDWIDYIWISPANDLKPKERLKWLKKCFYEYLIPSWKPIKTHWFGVTTFSIIKEIPFFSCDSTSWLSGAIYNTYMFFSKGKILTMNASTIRKKMGVDYWKKTTIEKYEPNLKAISDMVKYVNQLHKIHNLEYYLKKW